MMTYKYKNLKELAQAFASGELDRTKYKLLFDNDDSFLSYCGPLPDGVDDDTPAADAWLDQKYDESRKLAKHTPGKWKVASYVYYAGTFAEKEFCITAVKRGRIAKANKLADAKLIAAAPELLDIAKQALALHPSWDAAREVIAKATE